MPHLRRGSGHGFHAVAGKVRKCRSPEGNWVRVDSAVYSGQHHFRLLRPMIAKLITWAATARTRS
jgi:acetyl/propionyl-CoA carboxylase alpha subunit